MASLLAAGAFLTVNWRFAVVVLSLYGIITAAAPFMPRFGFFLPVISRGDRNRKAVALTFDDGPDPVATPALLRLLKQKNIPATFFVSGARAARYPGLIESIVENRHTVGNHSYRHDPMAYFRGAEAVRRDIQKTQEILGALGIVPLVYRPPVGILSPVLRKPLAACGLSVVNYSCRAFDLGNKRVRGLAFRLLKRVRPGDIILLHDIMPGQNTDLQIWLNEVEKVISGLKAMGLQVVPLEELIGLPVMCRCPRIAAES